MATTRKPAKRSIRKKAAAPTRGAATSGAKSRKRTTRSKSTRKAKASKNLKLKKTASRGLRLAREGLQSVRQAGGKAWEAVKDTTTQMVENVRDE
jgi:hypothetical protein